MRNSAIRQFNRRTIDYDFRRANVADMGGQEHVVFVKNKSKNSIKNPLFELFDNYTIFNIAMETDVRCDLTKNLNAQYISKYDLVISFDTLEHISQPFSFCKNMVIAAKPGGHIYLSTVFAWPYHGEIDYFRFTPDGLKSCFEELPIDCISCGWDGDSKYFKKTTGVFFFGKKHETIDK